MVIKTTFGTKLLCTGRIFSFCLLGSAYLFISSCNKSNDTPHQAASLPKTYTEDVRSSIIGNSLTTFNLSFDANNRLVSMVSNSSPGMKINYQYASGSYTLDLYNSNVLDIHETFWLNGNSFVDSSFQYNSTNDTTTEKYIYNANKQLIKKTEYEYHQSGVIPLDMTQYTYDNAGNLATELSGTANSIQYDYYTNLPYYNFFQIYFPQSKNLVRTAATTSGGYTEILTHYYSFDSQSRLTKDSASVSGVDLTVIKSYTY